MRSGGDNPVSMIEFADVNLVYSNGVEALSDVNLFIDKGEFVFLIGSTGSGKSSLLKLIYRDEKPTGGEVYINNHDITELAREKIPMLRRKIGVVFQDFKLLDYKTVGENVAYALEVTGYESGKIEEKVGMVLDVVGMTDRAEFYPEQLSGGEKQLTSIARALVHNPPVLLADEPTGNLDPDATWNTLKILDYINSKGTTILMATHDRGIIKKMSKRVVELRGGKIIRDDTPPAEILHLQDV